MDYLNISGSMAPAQILSQPPFEDPAADDLTKVGVACWTAEPCRSLADFSSDKILHFIHSIHLSSLSVVYHHSGFTQTA